MRSTLAQLREEERALSARRVRVQDRIDFLRAGGGGPIEDVTEQIAALEAEEHDLSRRRRELHERIELVRAELGSRRATPG